VLLLMQHAGGEEVAGLAAPALRSFRKQPRQAKCASGDPRAL